MSNNTYGREIIWRVRRQKPTAQSPHPREVRDAIKELYTLVEDLKNNDGVELDRPNSEFILDRCQQLIALVLTKP